MLGLINKATHNVFFITHNVLTSNSALTLLLHAEELLYIVCIYVFAMFTM